MPVPDGLSAARKIRKSSRPDAGTIQIIALSANAFAEGIQQCVQTGMNARLFRPIDMELLKETPG